MCLFYSVQENECPTVFFDLLATKQDYPVGNWKEDSMNQVRVMMPAH